MPKWIGYAANGGSDFEERKHLPRLADNHAVEMTTEGVSEGFGRVMTMLDEQSGRDCSWVEQFKGSRHFISPKAS